MRTPEYDWDWVTGRRKLDGRKARRKHYAVTVIPTRSRKIYDGERQRIPMAERKPVMIG